MDILAETQHVSKRYGETRAVDDVSIRVRKGRSLGLMGESGSGKTTLGMLMAGLEKATNGRILFMGTEIQSLKERKIRPLRKDLQMIFQSSGSVFDPGYTIGESIGEVLKNYTSISKKEREEKIQEALSQVGLEHTMKDRYVSQLSGGQCQRANIARALALHPKLVICDEPVSSLDFSIRRQILDLLNNIREKNGVTYLLITHDLSNVPYVCDEAAVMYQGRLVEFIDHASSVKTDAVHPYTRLLYDSLPASSPEERRIGAAAKYVSSMFQEPPENGCPFYSRCKYRIDICRSVLPSMKDLAPGHQVACHLYT